MGSQFLDQGLNPGHGSELSELTRPAGGTPKSHPFKVDNRGTSLVAQWLRIHLPMQGTRVRALGREDPTCCGATKPVHHNY